MWNLYFIFIFIYFTVIIITCLLCKNVYYIEFFVLRKLLCRKASPFLTCQDSAPDLYSCAALALQSVLMALALGPVPSLLLSWFFPGGLSGLGFLCGCDRAQCLHLARSCHLGLPHATLRATVSQSLSPSNDEKQTLSLFLFENIHPLLDNPIPV